MRGPARQIGIWLGVDGNPLRRPTDRLESAVRILLVLAFLIGGPLIAGLTGHLTDAAGMRQVRQERSWYQVNAVLMRSAPRPPYAYGSVSTFWVPAQWHTSTGQAQTADVPTVAGARAGTIERIWVDGDGHATGRIPVTSGVVALRTVLVYVLTLAVFGIVLLIVAGVTRWLLDRRRLIIWGIEWACFGPRWTSRR